MLAWRKSGDGIYIVSCFAKQIPAFSKRRFAFKSYLCFMFLLLVQCCTEIMNLHIF